METVLEESEMRLKPKGIMKLTNNIQYNAAKKAATELQAAIDAPVKDDLSTKLIEHNQRYLKNKLESIKAEINHFEKQIVT